MSGSSITQAMTAIGDKLNPSTKELLISWVGDSSTGAVPTLSITGNEGWWITKAQTNPGSTPPTAAYDITLVDADGSDILDGELLDRSASLTEIAVVAVQIPSGGLTFTIANQSAASATGTCKLFLNNK